MAHGYIGDGYGIDGGVNSDRDSDREQRSREDWRARDRDRGRDRGMMFSDRDRNWSAGEARWTDRDWDRDRGYSGSGSEYGEYGRSFSAHPDDHYRSWRDRHMSELDRDYQDYCREREQQFHQDFDAWRRQRHADYQPLRTGMTQTGMSHDPSGQVQVATEGEADQSSTDPMADATLGTTSERTSGRGRR